jgi:hypothetical protein
MGKPVGAEFATVTLGDARLNARAQKTLQLLSAGPSAGAPRVLTEAELEGYYRFVNNDRVSLNALVAAHARATVERASGRERLPVAHDTSDFRFRISEDVLREGLGPMDSGGQGFYAHFSLAVGGPRDALGVVAVETWTRTSRTGTRKTSEERYINPAKESLRWIRGVEEAERVFANAPRLIHVMDREADDFDILCKLVMGQHGFVVRGSYDRRLSDTTVRLKEFARALEVRASRDATLSPRPRNPSPKHRKLHPPRDTRVASLSFAAGPVILRRPDSSDAAQATLTLNVVHVIELEPPEGCEPIEWFLLTSEPIETEEQILQIVDDYRARWVIEEYFKALKTGCAYEKRQNESKDALLNTLGIYIPIAWSLLNMRSLSRDEVSTKLPAEHVLSSTQLHILRLTSKGKLAAQPTLGDAIYLMARCFGGLLPSNGAPGWAVLGRAWEKLLMAEVGWRLAMSVMSTERSDR